MGAFETSVVPFELFEVDPGSLVAGAIKFVGGFTFRLCDDRCLGFDPEAPETSGSFAKADSLGFDLKLSANCESVVSGAGESGRTGGSLRFDGRTGR